LENAGPGIVKAFWVVPSKRGPVFLVHL
jgi:hypothetical protein